MYTTDMTIDKVEKLFKSQCNKKFTLLQFQTENKNTEFSQRNSVKIIRALFELQIHDKLFIDSCPIMYKTFKKTHKETIFFD